MFSSFLPKSTRSSAGVVSHDLPSILVELAESVEVDDLPAGLFEQAWKIAVLRRSFHRTQGYSGVSTAQALKHPSRIVEARNLAGDAKGALGELIVHEFFKRRGISVAQAALVEFTSQDTPDLTFDNETSVDIKTASTLCSLTAQAFEGVGKDDKFVGISQAKHLKWLNRFKNFEGYLCVFVNIVDDVAISAKLTFVPNAALIGIATRNVGAGNFYPVQVPGFSSDNRGIAWKSAHSKLLTDDAPAKASARKVFTEYACWLKSLIINQEHNMDEDTARELLKLFKVLCIKNDTWAGSLLLNARRDDAPFFVVGV